MSKEIIKIIIADDHELVRMGIKRLLRDTKDMKVVFEAKTGEEALQAVKHHQPNVILLDINMPGIGGLETAKRLVRSHPNCKIIAVTGISNGPYPRYLLQAGVRGYLPKECSPKEMIDAIRAVDAGDIYINKAIAEQLVLETVNDTANDELPHEQLSERESQIMLMITKGLKAQEISDQLFLSTKTVNSYRYRIFSKLNIKNDVELTHYALRNKLIHLNTARDDAN